MGRKLGTITLRAVPFAVLHGIVAVRRTSKSKSKLRLIGVFPHEIFSLTTIVVIAVTSHSRLTPNQEHIEQAGRFHRVVVPRFYLCSFTVAVEQFAGRSRRNQTSPSTSVAFKQRLQPALHAGEQKVFKFISHHKLFNANFPPDELP